MTILQPSGLAAFRTARTSDAIDARFGYRVFLGRPAESREVRLQLARRAFPDLLGGFVHSQEFLDEVVTPLLAGRPVAEGRFIGQPEARLCAWVADRLLVDEDAAARARVAQDWTGLYQCVLADSKMAGVLEETFGPSFVQSFTDALALRRAGLGLSSTSAPSAQTSTLDPQADDAQRLRDAEARLTPGLRPPAKPAHGPQISLLLLPPIGPLDCLLRTVASVLSQSYARWELIVVDDALGRPEMSLMLDALALLDARIRIDASDAPTSLSETALAAYDVAQGEYIGLIACGEQLTFDALERLAHATVVHDRPEVVLAQTCLFAGGVARGEIRFADEEFHLVRTDAAARAGLYADLPVEQMAADLRSRIVNRGGRTERLAVILGGRAQASASAPLRALAAAVAE